MKIVSVVGARPQFIKLFPISRAIPSAIEHEIVHTGQHYDELMSQVFFDELAIPRPIINLEVGSGSHAQQTAAMMIGLEKAFSETKPDIVLVYGDTNSTLAASLVASKMHIPLAHLEAGLRSFNRKMPEELNRIATDHLSDLLLAPSDTAIENLEREGLGGKAVNIGDVMVDSTLMAQKMILNNRSSSISIEPTYIFCTIHRAENTDNVKKLSNLILKIAKSPIHIVLAAHPRVIERCKSADIDLNKLGIQIIQPQSYLSSIKLISEASGIITDSGGIQKEAHILETPTLTLRTETEWSETLNGDWNKLDPLGDLIATDWISIKRGERSKFLGNGDAAIKAFESIHSYSLSGLVNN
jgi:UDP-N-acetylglucosamine 2-epimerase (non-hydrolysing)